MDLDPGQKRALLAANELLAGASPETVTQVDAMAKHTTCEAGRVLFEPEQSGQVLFFLKRGREQLYRLSPDGKKLVVGEVEPGSFFGEMAVLGQGMAGSFAEATEDSVLCALSRTDVQSLLRREPEMAARVIERLAQRLSEAEARLETQAYQRLEARLASVLLRRRDPKDDVVRDISQQELAEFVGASCESVTRSLQQMAKDGLLEPGRRQIDLLDLSGIQALTRSAEA